MRREAIGFICLWAIVLSAGPLTHAVEFAGGTGTVGDPYQIATAEQLISIGSDPNLLSKHFVMVSDIDLDPNLSADYAFDHAVIAPDTDSSRPGFDGVPFSGSLDGRRRVIRNLTICVPALPASLPRGGNDHVGLFGKIAAQGVVSNLSIVSANLSGDAGDMGILVGANHGSVYRCSVSGSVLLNGGNAGGLAGCNSGNLSHCVSMSTVVGVNKVGGLVGMNNGTLSDCTSTSVTTGNSDVGGLAGYSTGAVDNCKHYGSVKGEENVGGLVGRNEGSLTRCTSTGTVTGGSPAGGLVGTNQGADAMVRRCASSGTVTGRGEVGGACGWNGGVLAQCSSGAHVSGTGDYCGGFVGLNGGSINACRSDSGVAGRDYVGGFMGAGGSVADCYSIGTVIGYLYVGGFTGAAGGSITHCYSICVPHAGGPFTDVGGFVGQRGRGYQLSGCFWDIEVSGLVANDGGKGMTTVQMQDVRTYLGAGWDVADQGDNGAVHVWVMPQNPPGYPRLAWE